MNTFKIGDIVQMTGPVMTGNVGTVVHIDEKRGKYLVRVTPQAQDSFAADDLRLYRS